MACRLDNGEIKPLLHPLEDMMLQELGFTFAQAMKDQRLLWVVNVVCDSCGDVAVRYAAKPRDSCLVNLAMFAVSMILSFFYINEPWGLLVGLAVFCLLLSAYAAIERYLIQDAQKLLPDTPTCTTCSDGRCKDFSRIKWRSSVCRECGERTVKYKHCGIS